MKFNAYIVRLDHPESNFTGNLVVAEKTHYVNFKKISNNLFIAHFKNQINLKFLETLKFKNKNKQTTIILPMISKFNKRKLKKISEFTDSIEEKSPEDIFLKILTIEKYLKASQLLNFFSLKKREILEFLIEMELNKKIKIIELNSLYIILDKTYQNYLREFKLLLHQCYLKQKKSLKLTEIESKLKLPYSAVFLRYLVRQLDNELSIKIDRDKIVFQKLALTEKEKNLISAIEKILMKNKLTIFTIENILNLSELTQKQVNDSLWILLGEERIIQLNQRHFIFNDELNKIVNRLKKYKRNQAEFIDIKTFKEITFLNRKNTITIFEYFDSCFITQRIGDKRKILLSV